MFLLVSERWRRRKENKKRERGGLPFPTIYLSLSLKARRRRIRRRRRRGGGGGCYYQHCR